MKKRLWPWVRRFLFGCVLVLCFAAISDALEPSYDAGSAWPTTATYRDFYKLEPQSVDVLFMGSSHVVRAFSPQELYNTYGLTSYNLGSEEQSMLVTYFWLEEALRTQSPKAVVLDTYFLFDYRKKELLNASEGNTRKSIDPMRMSKVKAQAIREICEADPDQSALSYYFPIIRYHDRWKEFEFASLFERRNPGLMGYSPIFGMSNIPDFEPFYAECGEITPMRPLMQEYLDRMTALCEEKGIRLILVKTPAPGQTAGKHDALRLYADEHQLDLIDFNESEVFYSGIDFWFETDCYDTEHANHWGAIKLTDYLGDFLTGECELESHEHPYWEASDALYQQIVEAGEENAI